MRVGQFKGSFMREELVDSGYQLAVERSIVNENLSIERTQGIEFIFSGDATSTLTISLNDGGTDQIGGFNLARSQPKNTDALRNIAEWAFTFRWEKLIAGGWRQFHDLTSPPGEEFGMMFGIAGHAQQGFYGVGSFFGPDERNWYGYTLDLSTEWGGANLFVSWTHHYLEIPNLFLNVYGAVPPGRRVPRAQARVVRAVRVRVVRVRQQRLRSAGGLHHGLELLHRGTLAEVADRHRDQLQHAECRLDA